MVNGSSFCRTLTFLAGLLYFTCSGTILAGDGLNAFPRAVNAAPILSKIESANLLYEKGSGRANITNSLTITDSDSKNLRSAAIRITEGYQANEDVLRFKNQNGINGSWNKTTGILNLSGSSSVANFQLALRSIQYENTNSTNPSINLRIVTITVNDGLSTSNTVSRNIVMVIPDIAPVLGGMESVSLIYCINSGEVPVSSSLSVTDADNDSLVSANVLISGKYTQNEDFLLYTYQNGIAGSWDASAGTLNLTGKAPTGNYQSALRSIHYKNTNAHNPVTGNRTISFTVNDGKLSSNAATRTIFVNDPVTASMHGTATVCNDALQDIPMQVVFTGTPPFKFTLIRDDGNETNYDNISETTFDFTVKQAGTYRIKSLSDASCTGDTTGSGSVKIAYNTPPTAAITGADTICDGVIAELSVTLTGKAPWNLTYQRNGSNSTEINNINSPNYTLKVPDTGTYTLASVTDAVCTNGRVSGSGIVVRHSSPTALLSGDATICENTSANLRVDLSGSAPWRFSYKHDGGTPVNIENVNASPGNISVNMAGNYTLFEVYDKYCKGSVSGSADISVLPTPTVSISGLSPVYSKEDNQMVLITGTPAGGTFSGPGLFYSAPYWYFLPGYAPVGTLDIVYAYQQSAGSCFGYDTAVVRVLEANAIIEFPDNRTTICRNEAPFTIQAVNLNNSIGHFSISAGGVLTNNGDNTASIDPHGLQAGEYTITYTYFDGTTLTVKKTFEIGNAPVADFKWASECFTPGQSIRLTDASVPSSGIITGYLWKIKNGNRTDTLKTENIEYTFPDQGKFTVSLMIQTSSGCSDDITKTLGLSVPIALADHPYKEDFEDSALYWQKGNSSSPATNSWMLSDSSKGFPHAASGKMFWHTYVPATTAPSENSWVTSPCFDFSGTQKPMILMNIWRKFNGLRDGATLQASADSGKTWNNIGQLDDGINWFNNYGIRGNPGGQSIGWSDIQDGNWIESRHTLDMLKGKTRVQIRLAYGSDGTALNTDGIAFDNVRIEERSRTTLLEHFTNASDSASRIADITLNAIAGEDSINTIDLQYHTSFPGNDPFNEQEPYTPSARSLYYGLSDVPYTILNGGYKASYRYDYASRKLNSNAIQYESLNDSKFNIHLYSELRGNTLYIFSHITALQNMPAREYTVHVGVMERKITGVTGTNGESLFENVVKAFLPDPAGTTLFKPWNLNETDSIENSWYLENVYNRNELSVFTFIQDETTQEIYQAALNKVDFVTGTKDVFQQSPDNQFIVFPNPATNQVFIRFNKPVGRTVQIEIYNDLGILIHTRQIPGTGIETEILTRDFPDGIYIVRALSGMNVLGNTKLNINH